MISGTLISPVFGVPMGIVMMLIVAGHAMSLRGAKIPASRRRIRQANAGLMVVLIPMLVVGTSVVNPSAQPVLWMQVWIAAMLLLAAVIAFAVLDMINTARLRRQGRIDLEREKRELEREATDAFARIGRTGGDDDAQ